MEGSVIHGSCACGRPANMTRNVYAINIPQSSNQYGQILLDNSSRNRRLQASPLTAWLRVPFNWFQSSTISLFPDETHQSIRRTYVSPFDSNTRHQFCGYCGTQLSQWGHKTRDEENYISLTLGSLLDHDLERLEDLGLLDPDTGDVSSTSSAVFKPAKGVEHRGAPWFESMIEDSRLGSFKRHGGRETSGDGQYDLEWEIVEWTSSADPTDESSATTTAKRKIGQVEGVEQDVEMPTQ